MRRVAFYLFYDERGIVDDYIIYKLEKLREFVDNIFVISNSKVDSENQKKIEKVCDTFQVRQNIGFDVWGYKEAMELFGREQLREYDELILLNYTFFGPIFPFSELFSSMEEKTCDFWGISAHKEVASDPICYGDRLPFHIQSHFIAVRKAMFTSKLFEDYWDEMPMIKSYNDSIIKHESRFTEHFHQAGFNFEVYLDPDDYPSNYALFNSVELATRSRSPILKKRIFIHDPIYLEQNAIFLRRAVEYIQAHSDYDISLIWKSVVRAAEPRTLYTNMDMLEILDDSKAPPPPDKEPRIAVIMHMFYSDMMSELLGYIHRIPYRYDLYVTTDTEQKKSEILSVMAGFPDQHIEIRLAEQNRGRDLAPLFITCKDILLSHDYDYICRLHSKKSPQDGYHIGQNFKEHMIDNLLYNRNYVANLLHLFDKEPQLGIIMPPVIHTGYGTMGHGWSINREIALAWAKKLGIHTLFDAHTPLAPYGSMYWFRADALKKLAVYDWRIQDFDVEVGKVDGTLAHALERLIVYAAMEAGYYARSAMNRVSAAVGYTKLEYKLQRISSLMPSGNIRSQIDWLELVNTHLAKERRPKRRQNITARDHLETAISLSFRAVEKKLPTTAKLFKPLWSFFRSCYRKVF